MTAAEVALSSAAAPCDLVIVDEQLLGASGTSIGTRLRPLPGAAGAAVLLLCRKRPSYDVMTAMGATGCLVTPLRPAPMLRDIVGVLAESPAPVRVPAPPAVPVPALLAARLPLRLLLADDNVVNQKVGAGLLKRFGYSVDVVANGARDQALDARPYDVIFLDLQMPEMDGFEAARQVRSRWAAREAARPRMIAMTSSASQIDRELSIEAGMDDYISKPFTVDTLRGALERWGPR